MSFHDFSVPYESDARYAQRVAYFSMEFAIHQPLKIYSGGLGFLAGSHLRSAYELKQNLIGIGILWMGISFFLSNVNTTIGYTLIIVGLGGPG
jgi:starch phosphorylase